MGAIQIQLQFECPLVKNTVRHLAKIKDIPIESLPISNCCTRDACSIELRIPPLLAPNEAAQITEVRVEKQIPRGGTQNLVEDIRVKTLNAAYQVSESGPKKVLIVRVQGFQSADPGMALFISSGSSGIQTEILLTDPTTGVSSKPEKVFAQNARLGGIIGAIHASTVDPIQDERSLKTQLANKIMVQIYGKEAVDRTASRTPQKKATANYPVSYQAEAERLKCRRVEAQNELEKDRAEEQQEDPLLTKMPEYCSKYPKES